jgi:2-haloacid dehalogenase
MEIPSILNREIKVLAFDQYGTIVDMQKGLTEAVTPFLKLKGWDGEPNSFVTWWRRTHFENSMIDALCDRGHTPYRQIGHRAVSYVMDRCGWNSRTSPTSGIAPNRKRRCACFAHLRSITYSAL